jgi:hypothetical protein
VPVLGGPRHLYSETWGRPDVLRVDVREPLFGRTIPVPEVSFVKDPGPPRIEWIDGKEHASPELDECLFAFTRLAKTPSDEQLADFAKRWGPLGICKHGWPSTHMLNGGSPCVPLSLRERYWEHHTEQSDWHFDYWTGPGEVPLSELKGKYWEPLVAWRFYIWQFAAALNIAYSLQEGRAARREDWTKVLGVQDGTNMDEEFAKPEWKPLAEGIENGRQLASAPIEDQRAHLASDVTRWLLITGVSPWVSWEAERAQLGLALGRPIVPPGDPFSRYEWHKATLFGVLATQLATVVTGGGEFATCGKCGQPYKPTRKPAANRRHFCSSGCQKDAHRAADAEYRRQKRRTLRQLGTPTDTPTPTNTSDLP